MITYLSGGEAANTTRMNALFSAFDTRLVTLLGGRSFILAFKPTDGGGSTIPANLFGKTFFFTDGASAYAHLVPGAIAKTYTVHDPITDTSVSASGVRPYDHDAFDDAEAAATASSYDTVNHVVTIPNVSGTYYTDGLTSQAGVSLFDHSLRAHRKSLTGPGDTEPHDYYLRETSRYVPEKRYKYSVADLILEGVTSVDFDDDWDKYNFFRIHNLNLVSATVDFGGHYTATIPPLSVRCVRRDSVTENYRASSRRYFWDFEEDDPRGFWYWPSVPAAVSGSPAVSGRQDLVVTAAGGMQGNNLINPTILYEFIKALSITNSTQVAVRDDLFTWFIKDVHELCDSYPQYDTKFGDPSDDETLFGDLIHHKGRIKLARVSTTVPDPDFPAYKFTTYEDLEFNGYASIAADFAAKSITVATNGSGHLTLDSTDAANNVYLIPLTTNLFFKGDYAAQPNVIQTAALIDSAFELGYKFFELSGSFQDITGVTAFSLSNTSKYRITQRSLASAANDKTYTDIDGVSQTVTGTTTKTLSEVTLGSAGTIASVHALTVDDITDLHLFGNPALGSQSDSHVTYSGAALLLTPEGLVLKFTEQVRSDVLPTLPSSFYENFAGSKLEYNAGSGKFECKHLIRFRELGWGYGEHGRKNAAFFSPVDGRCTGEPYTREVTAPDGGDFFYPLDPNPGMIGIEYLRRAGYEELQLIDSAGAQINGGRFFTINKLDGSVGFILNYTQNPWFQQNKAALASGDSSIPRLFGRTSRPHVQALLAEHYNAMAQAVNQLKHGHPIDVYALRFRVGAKTLNMEALRNNAATLITGLAHWTRVFNASLPAPMNCFAVIYAHPGASEDLTDYWLYFLDLWSVPILDESDFPDSFSTWQDEFNVKSTLGCESQMWLSDSSYVDIGDPIADAENRRWKAHVHGFCGNWGFTDAEDGIDQGIAYIDTGDGRSIEADTVNLNTAYSGIQWISDQGFSDFCSVIGFPCNRAELVMPLKLAWAEVPTDIFADRNDGLSNELDHGECEVGYGRIIVPGFGETIDPAVVLDYLDEFVGPVVSWPLYVVSAGTAHDQVPFSHGADLPLYPPRKAILFRQATSAGEAAWKIPTTDYTIYENTRRNDGSGLMFGVQMYMGMRSSHAVSGAYGLSAMPSEPYNTGVNFNAVAPFIGADDDPGWASVGGGDQYNLHWRAAGPASYVEIWDDGDTLSGTDQGRFDTWLRWYWGERRILACHILGTGWLPLMKFARTQWSHETDWWQTSIDHTYFWIVGNTNGYWQELAAGSNSQENPTGTTILQAASQKSFRLLFDPTHTVAL